jgi:hypothetical protein
MFMMQAASWSCDMFMMQAATKKEKEREKKRLAREEKERYPLRSAALLCSFGANVPCVFGAHIHV